ncbi:MAG: DUF952 domain-containing protein [Phycisphaerae bacterium]|nr:DUF952 domain-containing protein [Phycisphaerae bacterium]
MAYIVHITHTEQWQAARESGLYQADTLTTQGFIHCSTLEQVIPVADFLFRGRKGLVLLEIDTDQVQAEIKYENLEGGTKLFPHIYGPIPINAVRKVHDFLPQPDGSFELPKELRVGN